MVLSYVTEINM